MSSVAAAYPFVSVVIDTSALQPVAQRSPGVIAIVGATTSGGAVANAPTVVANLDDIAAAFGATSTLGKSLALALLQDPAPSKIYGVRVASNSAADYTAALDTLLAADDIDFVALAQVSDTALLVLLKEHVEQASAAGNKRLGVAMVDPTKAKSLTYVADVLATLHPSTGPDLLSTVGRMVWWPPGVRPPPTPRRPTSRPPPWPPSPATRPRRRSF